MAAAVSSAFLTTSAAALDLCGASETRVKPASRTSSAAGAFASAPLSHLRQVRQLNRPNRSARLGRVAVRAALPASPSSSPASGDEVMGVLPSAEWSNNFSYLTYEDLSAYYQSAILKGLEEDSESASQEVSPLLPSRSHGVISGEWDKSVTMQTFEELSSHLEDVIKAEETAEPVSPLLPSRSHGVLSGEWNSNVSILNYQDLTEHLQESIVENTEAVSPLLPSRSHGVLSGEWDQSAALLSYQDLTLHLEEVIRKEESQRR